MAPVRRFDVNRILAACEVEGLDPSKVVSCIPSDGKQAVPGVRGCNQADRCIFHLTANGGFMGTLPHEVGYFYDPAEGRGFRKEDHCPCFRFMYAFADKMAASGARAAMGLKAETVQIVAQEGELIRVSSFVPVNPADKSETAMYRRDTKMKKVPKYDYRLYMQDGVEGDYERELADRQQRRDESKGVLRTGPPTRLREEDLADDQTMEMGTSNAVLGEADDEPEQKAAG